jgi:hypothetical protein
MKLPKNTEGYMLFDGFWLRLERQHQTLHLRVLDNPDLFEHDRNEMLHYFMGAPSNPELLENLTNRTKCNHSGVLWYAPITLEDWDGFSSNKQFLRMQADFEQHRQHGLEEMVWTFKFVPTMQDSTFMAHSTVLTLLEIIQLVSEARTDFPSGVEVFNEDQYELSFGMAQQTGLLPSLLNDLESDAQRYAELFEQGGRLFTPNEAEFWRENILGKLEKHNLINCEISRQIFVQLKKYPNLNRVVLAAEYFAEYMDFTSSGQKIQDCVLALDWMMFDPDFPSDFEMDSWDFLQHCITVFEAAKLEYPYTLQTELSGQQYRLITGFDGGRIKLLTVLEPKTTSSFFVDPYKPSYLELVDWFSYAGRYDPAMNWDLVMQWDGLLEELTDLAADPNLPDADYLLHCLYCHVSLARGAGASGFLGYGRSFERHPSPRIQRLSARCWAVGRGELEFVYADWCGYGFVQQENAQ